MSILYNIVFIIFAFFYLPIFLFKGKRRQGIGLRFGAYSKQLVKSLGGKKNIWIHAVSVGEVMAVLPLIKLIRERHPDYRIVITTVTETGNSAAKRIKRDDEIVLFLPFDITFVIKKVIRYIAPIVLIIVETELWPNLIREIARSRIKIFLVNGRISDNSLGKYRLIKPLLKNMLAKISLFFMQTEEQRIRIISLGADASRVTVSGNMKFDNVSSNDSSKQDKEKIRLLLGLDACDRLFIAGSTHPGEEEIVLNSYIELKEKFSNLRLLIAPRHIDRAKEIQRLIIDLGLIPVFVSSLFGASSNATNKDILILDTIGQLRSFYNIAETAFVGGSLIKRGGQNMIEPAAFAKPLLLGPHTDNFRDIVEMFLKNSAIIVVEDEEALTESLRGLLSDATLRDSLGRSAQLVVQSGRGATMRILQSIEDEKIFL